MSSEIFPKKSVNRAGGGGATCGRGLPGTVKNILSEFLTNLLSKIYSWNSYRSDQAKLPQNKGAKDVANLFKINLIGARSSGEGKALSVPAKEVLADGNQAV